MPFRSSWKEAETLVLLRLIEIICSEFGFQLETKRGTNYDRVFAFCTDSAAERSDWISSIKHVIVSKKFMLWNLSVRCCSPLGISNSCLPSGGGGESACVGSLRAGDAKY